MANILYIKNMTYLSLLTSSLSFNYVKDHFLIDDLTPSIDKCGLTTFCSLASKAYRQLKYGINNVSPLFNQINIILIKPDLRSNPLYTSFYTSFPPPTH